MVLIGFAAVLITPLIQLQFRFLAEDPVLENRKLSNKPPLSSSAAFSSYPQDFVTWYNDHFGFRGLFIKIKNQIDFSIFGISSRIHIGKDGWLFYRSVLDIEKPSIDSSLKTLRPEVVKGVANLAIELNKRGVRLIVLIAPMKDVFYENYLPLTVKRLPKPSQINLLNDDLLKISNLVLVNSKEILSPVASERNVFHKTDFHWNDAAAFEINKSVVNRLGILEGKGPRLWNHDLKIEKRAESGGEAMFMPLFFPIREEALYVQKTWQDDLRVTNTKIFPFVTQERSNFSKNADLLKPVLMIGDSFLDGMIRAGLDSYFKKTYQTNWNEVDIKTLLENIPKDVEYVLMEFIEVSHNPLNQLAKLSSTEGR